MLIFFWGEYTGNRVDMSDFLSDAVYTQVYDCNVKSLPIEKAFIELCLHHYKEMHALYSFFLANPFCERMFQDVSAFYHRQLKHKPALISEILEFAELYDIREVFYYVFYYTNIVFPHTNLAKTADLFKTEKGENELNLYGLSETERKEWKIPFSEKMNHENIVSLVQPELSEADQLKVDAVLSIF